MIENYHDEAVKNRLNEFFDAFMAGDPDRMKACQAEDYHMDDYRKANPLCPRVFSYLLFIL